MGWSGGTFTRVHDWTTDEGSAIDIEASRMDAEDDNFASGINACLTKDGSNTPTGNLPMGGNRHTGVGNAAALTDYASAADVIDQHLVFYNDTGSANTMVITPSPAITVLADGQKFAVRMNATNTGATTLNVNGLGAKGLINVDGEALVGGELINNRIYEFIYDVDESSYQVISPTDTGTEFIKYALNNEARTSTTTLADSAQGLTDWQLDAAAYYAVEGFLFVSHATTFGGIKIGLEFTQTPQSLGGWGMSAMDMGGSIDGDSGGATGIQDSLEVNNNDIRFAVHIKGGFKANGTTGGKVDFQFAQQTSSSSPTTLLGASWIRITRIN